MPPEIYTVDVPVYATAYVRAESAEEAARIASNAMASYEVSLRDGMMVGDVEVSGKMPSENQAIVMSPVMTTGASETFEPGLLADHVDGRQSDLDLPDQDIIRAASPRAAAHAGQQDSIAFQTTVMPNRQGAERPAAALTSATTIRDAYEDGRRAGLMDAAVAIRGWNNDVPATGEMFSNALLHNYDLTPSLKVWVGGLCVQGEPTIFAEAGEANCINRIAETIIGIAIDHKIDVPAPLLRPATPETGGNHLFLIDAMRKQMLRAGLPVSDILFPKAMTLNVEPDMTVKDLKVGIILSGLGDNKKISAVAIGRSQSEARADANFNLKERAERITESGQPIPEMSYQVADASMTQESTNLLTMETRQKTARLGAASGQQKVRTPSL